MYQDRWPTVIEAAIAGTNLLTVAFLMISFASIATGIHPSGSAWGDSVTPEYDMAAGTQAFKQGKLGVAIASWREAARGYEHQRQPQAQSTALTNLSAAYQALGQYQKALASLRTAQKLVEQTDDQVQLATVLASLGNVYIALGPAETAERYLRQALDMAKALDQAELAANVLNNLGNLLTAQDNPQGAFAAYQESVTFAERAGLPMTMTKAQANAAMTAIRLEQFEQAQASLARAWELIQHFAPSHEVAYGLTKIGLGYEALWKQLPQPNNAHLLHAANAFTMASKTAQTLDDERAASYAWGYLGRLYEAQRRYAEALILTRRAVSAAQRVHAPESLYRWQWQLGRLLHAQGNDKAATTAYQHAIDVLQSIRPELAVSYGKPPTVFRETTGRLYFELVDLLLQRAAVFHKPEAYTPYLQEARRTVERFKAAELRDYFRDECVDAALAPTVDLDRLAQTAVIIYPILLPDRLELLVSLPQGLRRFTVPVEATRIERVARRFRVALQEGAERRYLLHAQRLYNWLVRPLEAELTSVNVRTLVFVPDGPLRTIPMAALHDGKAFLIETYAVAVTPGLALTDPRPLTQQGIHVLAVGITEPRQGFAALSYVSDELATIQQLYGGTVLLNQDFLVARMEEELRKEDFGIVHIASHGKFTGNAEQSFVLAFDDKLSMDRLQTLVGRLRFRDDPLELLTLSACETAVGDDRAALGLAGVAIKAGARSALATLWRVADEAAAVLVTEFYRQLKDPLASRAVALQRAQLKLFRNPRYQSPFFWAPFLLINNWF